MAGGREFEPQCSPPPRGYKSELNSLLSGFSSQYTDLLQTEAVFAPVMTPTLSDTSTDFRLSTYTPPPLSHPCRRHTNKVGPSDAFSKPSQMSRQQLRILQLSALLSPFSPTAITTTHCVHDIHPPPNKSSPRTPPPPQPCPPNGSTGPRPPAPKTTAAPAPSPPFSSSAVRPPPPSPSPKN